MQALILLSATDDSDDFTLANTVKPGRFASIFIPSTRNYGVYN